MPANFQEMFTKAFLGLKSQDFRQSSYRDEENVNNCLYRGLDGMRCAVGWMIPDDKYDPKMEGQGAGHPEILKVFDIPSYAEGGKFLLDLQAVHDDDEAPANTMEQRLREFATLHGLEVPA